MGEKFSPELEEELGKERAKSDVEKLRTGAEVREGGRIEVTKEQVKEARLEMIKSKRESGDKDEVYRANSMESAMLMDELEQEGFKEELEKLTETLPEGLKRDVKAISEAMNSDKITRKQGLEDLKRLLKPSFFESGKGPKGMVGKMLTDARYSRLAELADEERDYWKQEGKEVSMTESEKMDKLGKVSQEVLARFKKFEAKFDKSDRDVEEDEELTEKEEKEVEEIMAFAEAELYPLAEQLKYIIEQSDPKKRKENDKKYKKSLDAYSNALDELNLY